MPTDVILDVDTGVDDALALLLAARQPGLRLRAVTCVAGNTGVDAVVHNTLTVLQAAGRGDVPVARGADRPLLRPMGDARHVHGADGMGDLGLSPPESTVVDAHAVQLLRRMITQTPGITVIALAPLTNLALLLRTHPEVTDHIGRVVFMGGSIGAGNTTAAAEFNIWHDPEAAAIVLDSGVPLTMYGLDVFYRVTVAPDGVKRLLDSPRPGAALAGRLLDGRIGYGRKETRMPRPEDACLGDAGAVCAVADPEGIATREYPVHVSLADGPTRGMTLVDTRGTPGRVPLLGQHPIGTGLADVAMDVDARRYEKLYLDTIEGHDGR